MIQPRRIVTQGSGVTSAYHKTRFTKWPASRLGDSETLTQLISAVTASQLTLAAAAAGRVVRVAVYGVGGGPGRPGWAGPFRVLITPTAVVLRQNVVCGFKIRKWVGLTDRDVS